MPPPAPSLSLLISPSGQLRLDPDPPRPAPLDEATARAISTAFASGAGAGLIHLGAAELGAAIGPTLGYFRDLGRTFIARLCQLAEPEAALARGEPPLDEGTLAHLLLTVPPVRGAENLAAAHVRGWWNEARAALATKVAAAGSVEAALSAYSAVWSQVGRVHFHLAENRADPDRPFAFLATYTVGVTAAGKIKHAPLGHALREHAGARNRAALVALLAPIDRAAEHCTWVKELLDSGALYQPLAWTPAEAMTLLRDVEALEAAGLMVRVPEHWGRTRPPRATVQVSVGGRPPGDLGAEALLEFDVSVALDGEKLGPGELEELLAATGDLVLLRGRWVEIDRDGVTRLLARWQEAQRAQAEGLPFHEAVRLVAGADLGGDELAAGADEPVEVVAGPWLAQVLEGLRSPDGLAAADPGPELLAELRPYQQIGVRWLHWLRALGLGGCLADDMGLGKTLQAIALFVNIRRTSRTSNGHSNGHAHVAASARAPSLVVAPASLLGNWRLELERFAPTLRVLVAHPSESPAAELRALAPETLAAYDVVVTSYGTLRRVPALTAQRWDVVVADEAQAIKNARTKQAQVMRTLRARCRLALTGTPVENRLADLWSIFAFTNPGLLGNEREFSAFVKSLEARPHDSYGPLRALVRPYILRRLKTQREIIADLPDKTEVKAFCALARKQTALYQQTVQMLARELAGAEGVARKGVVLTALTRLKQICNHPSNWLRDGGWSPGESGKLQRLGELCDEIAARQDKVLVFTQFKEATAPLAAFLGERFGRTGLVLSGETAIGRRQKLVDEFQREDGPPFFVLSLRAGGTGLNLTGANHVIHFDRWWNPAVEDQATDRAFRIGQRRNVLVHKLICRGTLEERIDALIESKRDLARQLIEGDGTAALTELSDDEILRLVSLDVRTASAEPS